MNLESGNMVDSDHIIVGTTTFHNGVMLSILNTRSRDFVFLFLQDVSYQ